jgi:DNA-binding response OmpR family regulator
MWLSSISSMEDMDGIEVVKIFKKMDERMPVIMLTGHGSEQAVSDGIAFGVYDCLTKPCDLEELMVRIRGTCQGKGCPSE